MATWTSKRKYQLSRGVGYVVQMGRGFVIDIAGRKFMIPRDVGENIKKVEELGAGKGRPSFFSEPTSMRGITLPERIWEWLDKNPAGSYSKIIASILEEAINK
jgi:hypothetical protein